MKNVSFLVSVLTLMISVSSCGSDAKNDKVGKRPNRYSDSIRRADSLARYGTPLDIQFAEATDKANDDKRVTVIGYIDVPHISYSTGNKTGQLGLIERPNQMFGTFDILLSLQLGKGNNTMKALPDKYTPDDVVVTGKSGEKVNAGDRVKMTGILHVNESYTSLDVQEIEKMENVEIDYSALNATKISGPEKPGKELDGKLVVTEGMLEMPVLTMSGDLTFLYLKVPDIKDKLTVNIAYGTGPGKLEPLPDNYTTKDIKIQNNKGELIDMKKKVRVYGIWKKDRIQIELVENV